jgi:hypothetical protein
LINRSPSTTIQCKTSEDLCSGSPSKYDHLRVFRCPAYAHIKEDKLDFRSKKYIFFGYGDGVKGYRLWCPETKKLIVNQDVNFDEIFIFTPEKNEVGASSSKGASKSAETTQVEL